MYFVFKFVFYNPMMEFTHCLYNSKSKTIAFLPRVTRMETAKKSIGIERFPVGRFVTDDKTGILQLNQHFPARR